MNVDTQPTDRHTDQQASPAAGPDPHGPFARIVAASLVIGLGIRTRC